MLGYLISATTASFHIFNLHFTAIVWFHIIWIIGGVGKQAPWHKTRPAKWMHCNLVRFPAFYGIRRYVLCRAAHCWSPSSARWSQYTFSNHIFMSILVLICYLGFHIIPFYIFQPKPGINLPYRCLLHACPSHHPSFVKSNYIWWGVQILETPHCVVFFLFSCVRIHTLLVLVFFRTHFSKKLRLCFSHYKAPNVTRNQNDFVI
jgi:hypothetical protein